MRLREGVRALILDPDDCVLLVRFDWDSLDVEGGFWASPGGGVEPGETRLELPCSELREETGLIVDYLGPEDWTKTATFPMTEWDGQVDHIHLYRTERFVTAPAMPPAQLKPSTSMTSPGGRPTSWPWRGDLRPAVPPQAAGAAAPRRSSRSPDRAEWLLVRVSESPRRTPT